MIEITYAVVRPNTENTTAHFEGVLADDRRGMERIRQMPPTAVVTLIPEQDGWLLYRWDSDGSVVNDTWHQTQEEAISQARREFGAALGDFQQTPSGVDFDSLEEFVLSVVLEPNPRRN